MTEQPSALEPQSEIEQAAEEDLKAAQDLQAKHYPLLGISAIDLARFRAQAREAAEAELAQITDQAEWAEARLAKAEKERDEARADNEKLMAVAAEMAGARADQEIALEAAEARVREMQADFDAAVHSFNHVFPDRDVDSGPPHQRFGMLLRFLAARLHGVEQEAKDLEFQNELYREAVEAVVEDSEDDGPINWGLNSVQNAKGVLERFKALARTETPKHKE